LNIALTGVRYLRNDAGVRCAVLDVTGLRESDDGSIRQARITRRTRSADQHSSTISTGQRRQLVLLNRLMFMFVESTHSFTFIFLKFPFILVKLLPAVRKNRYFFLNAL